MAQRYITVTLETIEWRHILFPR